MSEDTSVNKEATREWLVALRSGEYRQGTGQLARTYEDGKVEYCCLGVACELFADRLKLSRKVYLPGKVSFADESMILPAQVQDHLGFARANPIVERDGDWPAVSELNDEAGLSFTEIADLIEATYLRDEGE